MRAYVGQTRSAKLIEELRALGWGECTCRGEYPPRRVPWFPGQWGVRRLASGAIVRRGSVRTRSRAGSRGGCPTGFHRGSRRRGGRGIQLGLVAVLARGCVGRRPGVPGSAGWDERVGGRRGAARLRWHLRGRDTAMEDSNRSEMGGAGSESWEALPRGAGRDAEARSMGVSMGPGHTQLTRMFSAAWSTAIARVRPMTPALVAE